MNSTILFLHQIPDEQERNPMQIGMDTTAEWILLWYGEVEWHEYFGMRFAYPHPRGLAEYWRQNA